MDWLKFLTDTGGDIWALIKKYFVDNAQQVKDKLTPYLEQSKDDIAKWTEELATGVRSPQSYQDAMIGEKAVIGAQIGYAALITEEQFQKFFSDLIQLLINKAKSLV